jgi:hypothetical protein
MKAFVTFKIAIDWFLIAYIVVKFDGQIAMVA